MTRGRLVAAALLVAVACPAPDPVVPRTSPASTPSTGGSITIAYPSEPPTLDPFAAAGVAPATRDLVRLLMPALARDDGTPWLLDAEPVVEQGPPFRVRVTIRADARWSDGARIGVDDLRRTWRRARRSVVAGEVYRWIEGIERVDARTAWLRFDRPRARWREAFSAGLGVAPAQVDDFDGPWPVSGGPFVLARWRRGLDMRFVRNERAPPAEAPSLDEIRVVFVPDATGALRLFERGEVDALGPYHAPEWIRRLTDAGALVATANGSSAAWLVWDPEHAPLRSRAVRSALPRAFDHGRIVRGLVGTEGVAPGAAGGADLRDARAALRRAGWTGEPIRARGGRPLEITVAMLASEDLLAIVANAVKFQVERAGIRLELVGLEPIRLFEDWLWGPDMQAAALIARDPAPPLPGIKLYDVAVTLAGGPAAEVTAHAGPDGAFATAHTWRAPVT